MGKTGAAERQSDRAAGGSIGKLGARFLHIERRNARRITTAKDLIVYRKAYELALEIFRLSRGFPVEERYSLTDQIRRSSRSVCTNLREAWAKRRYRAHFLSKLSDCDGENGETDTWLDFATDANYLTPADYQRLKCLNVEVGKMLGDMLNSPGSFILPLAR